MSKVCVECFNQHIADDQLCPDCRLYCSIRSCSKCLVEIDEYILEPHPSGNGGLLCPECYEVVFRAIEKSICPRCNPDAADTPASELCRFCLEKGWKSFYDFYSGKDCIYFQEASGINKQ